MSIKKSINSFQIVGTLDEINLEVEEKEVVLKGNGTEKKVTCDVISKKDFKNPAVTVSTTCGGVVGVDFFPTYAKKIDDNGKVVDNPRFKSLLAVFDFVPKETRVKVDASLNVNEYVNDKEEYISIPRLNAFAISHSNVPEDDCTDGDLSGIIKSIKDEVRNEEETGRKIVEFYHFDYNGATLPISLVVSEDLADDFENIYEVGSACLLNVEVVSRQVGAKKQTGGFGHRDTKKISGFTVTEFSVFNGQDPYEEESEHYVSKEDFKKALSERKIMIDAKVEEKKNKDDDNGSSKSKGLGKRPSKVENNPFEEETTEESPKSTKSKKSEDDADPFADM